MRVSDNMQITKRSTDGAFYGERNGQTFIIERTNDDYNAYDSFYNVMRSTSYAERPQMFQELLRSNRYPSVLGSEAAATTAAPKAPEKTKKEILLEGIQGLMDFFTEFSFVPSFRFVNTFSYMACIGEKEARDYVRNYFALMDSSYAKEVAAKTQSAEFKRLISNIAQYGAPQNHVNTRLKIYYGSAGTGKTTLAQEEAENRCIVCNSSMLPSDLMEDFIFKDGNPDFNPSLLWDCMEQGKKVVLDEINLLPFDSLRFLQGIADGKTEFYYKNRPVHIHEGFQIIGTMNLSLGGMVYGLPEPLVDRCADMHEFTLTADQLAKAILGMEDEE